MGMEEKNKKIKMTDSKKLRFSTPLILNLFFAKISWVSRIDVKGMAIQVVEFSSGVYKIGKIFA